MLHLVSVLVLCFYACATEQAAALPPHPRIILTPTKTAAIRALNTSSDPFAQTMAKKTIAQGDWVLSAWHGPHSPFLGSTDARATLQALYSLALASAVSGDARYLKGAVPIFMSAATAPGGWDPNGTAALNTGEMLHVMGVGFDWLYPLLTPVQRAAAINGTVVNGLGRIRAGFLPSPPVYTKGWMSTASNWNTVVLGGTVIGCLGILDEPGVPDWVGGLMEDALGNVVNWSVPAWAPSGAWPEGPNYGGYTVRYLVPLVASLLSATGGDRGIRGMEGVLLSPRWLAATMAPISSTPPPGGQTGGGPQFWDYFDSPPIPETIGSSLALAGWGGDGAAAAAIKSFLLQRQPATPANTTENAAMDAPLSLLYYTPLGTPGQEAELPLVALFQGPLVATSRSSWSSLSGGGGGAAATFIGWKGLNTTTLWAHTHLDAGSFVFASQGVWFGCDLGSDSYSAPGYFSNSRWELYRTNATGHNGVSFGGKNTFCEVISTYQANCSAVPFTVFNVSSSSSSSPPPFAPPPSIAATGSVTPSLTSTPLVDVFSVLDLSEAYKTTGKIPGLQRIQRGLIVLGGRTQLVTVDEVEFTAGGGGGVEGVIEASPLTPPLPLWWSMHTTATPTLSPNGTSVTLVMDLAPLPVTVEILGRPSTDCPGAGFTLTPIDLLPPLKPSPGLVRVSIVAPSDTCKRLAVAVGVEPQGVGEGGVRPLGEWETLGPLV